MTSEQLLRASAILPACAASNHEFISRLEPIAILNLTSPSGDVAPGTLMIFTPWSVDMRYSIGSTLVVMPLSSENWATFTPSTVRLNRLAEIGDSTAAIAGVLSVGLVLQVSLGGDQGRAHSSSPAPPLNWLMRNTTNSAGFTGAMPISTIRIPASRFSGGLFSASHLTKKAWAGVRPNSAPSRHTRRRNIVIVRLTESQSFGSFGSNTTQLGPFRMDFST